MRIGRMSVDQQDLEAGLLEDETNVGSGAILSQPITPSSTLASQGSPRSPIFMLSIAQKGVCWLLLRFFAPFHSFLQFQYSSFILPLFI